MNYTGILPAEILLPNVVDMKSWACIACDQFTSEKKYWQNLEQLVKGKKTTLDLVLPEIYLNDDLDGRIKQVNENIKSYLKSGVFKKLDSGFILTVRSTPFVKKRIGIIGMIDLDAYKYSSKSDALIRSTEGVIEERIPPRLKIRQNADVEFPHVMILYDDEKREIAEQLYEKREKLQKLYDFELNMGGGHIQGYYIKDVSSVEQKFSNLLDEERLISKYGKCDKFAFAVGDGNHSLATAKTLWEGIKQNLTEQEKLTHPARYALAEFVNIYDEGIYFEPIYRFIKGIDKQKFVKELKSVDCGNARVYYGENRENLVGKESIPVGIKNADEFIKEYIKNNGGEVDYIHGEENLISLIKEFDGVGVLFNKIDKSNLFRYVIEKGAFPRKTFSMGEGVEKRYYLEGRRITK